MGWGWVKGKVSSITSFNLFSPFPPRSLVSLQVTAACLNYLPLAHKLNRPYRESERQRGRKRQSERVRCFMKRVSVVKLMQFLSRSLHSLSPGLDNELVNTLQAPSPLGPYLLCTIGSERYFWSPSSHLCPWFGDDDNHCGLRCHIQINCHSSSAISPAITPPAKLPPSYLSWRQYKNQPSSTSWYVSLLSLFKSGVWKLTLFAL